MGQGDSGRLDAKVQWIDRTGNLLGPRPGLADVSGGGVQENGFLGGVKVSKLMRGHKHTVL